MENKNETYLLKSYRAFKRFASYKNDSLSLILITYGTGKLLLNGRDFDLKRGSLCFITPFDCFLFESDPDTELQGWIVQFSFDFVLDFIADPFIDLYTFQVLREKNGIAQLNNDYTIDVNAMIEDLEPEPNSKGITEYLGNRNALSFLFSLANDSLHGFAPQIGGGSRGL